MLLWLIDRFTPRTATEKTASFRELLQALQQLQSQLDATSKCQPSPVEVKNSEWQIQNPNRDKFSLYFAHFDYFSVTNLEWTF